MFGGLVCLLLINRPPVELIFLLLAVKHLLDVQRSHTISAVCSPPIPRDSAFGKMLSASITPPNSVGLVYGQCMAPRPLQAHLSLYDSPHFHVYKPSSSHTVHVSIGVFSAPLKGDSPEEVSKLTSILT